MTAPIGRPDSERFSCVHRFKIGRMGQAACVRCGQPPTERERWIESQINALIVAAGAYSERDTQETRDKLTDLIFDAARTPVAPEAPQRVTDRPMIPMNYTNKSAERADAHPDRTAVRREAVDVFDDVLNDCGISMGDRRAIVSMCHERLATKGSTS